MFTVALKVIILLVLPLRTCKIMGCVRNYLNVKYRNL